MKVATFINGSIISENSSFYAIKYAKKLNLKVYAIYIKEKISTDEVKKSYENIKLYADNLSVKIDFIILEDIYQLKSFIEKENIVQIFTSTKHKHTIFESSFAKSLLKKDLKSDIAIVKIVKIGDIKNIDKIILPIREDKLSVKKFTFFMTFALTHSAKAQIYSIDKVTRNFLAFLDENQKSKKVKNIIFNLGHYFNLAKLMKYELSIKHDFTMMEEIEKVNAHIAKYGFDLAIVGGHHKESFFNRHPIDILFTLPIINTIYFIPYKEKYYEAF
ncbi:hypothetical protein [Nitrosophilus kaiyonis]|uniref:hypothetical protein n=1 Tax=Nitrosophilus kaiyonis TaxID=2930200 RepID=UPI00248FF22A|nr:hypothetical protein [Nitrosophilus kaiyonis]